MQEEAFRIQKNMHIIAKDLQLLDLSKRDIREILIKAGVNKDLAKNVVKGKFVPVNYSEPRFNTKVETIEGQLKKRDGNSRRSSDGMPEVVSMSYDLFIKLSTLLYTSPV